MYTQPHTKKVLCAIVSLTILCGLLGLNGCIKDDEETAARAEELRTELARVKELLDHAQNQRETLMLKLENMSDSLMETQTRIQVLVQGTEEIAVIKTQLAEAIGQWDVTMTEVKETHKVIEQLQNQFQQQIQKTTELQTAISEMQKTTNPPVEESDTATDTDKRNPNLPIVGFPSMEDYK